MNGEIFTLAVATAAFAASFLVLEAVVGGGLAAVRRHSRWSAALRPLPGPVSDTLPEDEYLGLPNLNWNLLQLAGAVAGVLALSLVFAETTPQFALAGLAGGMAPRLARRQITERARERHLGSVRDFITSLRLMVSMGDTLSRSLMRLAEGEEQGLFGRRLRHHVATKLASSPETVIEALSQDFRSPELENLLLRLRASQKGGLSGSEAVRSTAEEVEVEMAERAELAIEEAPTKLVLPMLVGLFPTILVLLLYPLANAFLAGLNAGT